MRQTLAPYAAIPLVALLLAAQSAPARAQSAARDPVAAQTLFDVAKRLMADGKYGEACPKLEESERLDPAIGTHYTMAECYEKAGRLATAWVTYLDVASESAAEHRADREQYARARATALEPRLARIVVSVKHASAAKDLRIQRDTESLREAQWGVPVPVDPGTHVITASAPGKLPWRTTAVATEDGKTVTIEVPALADAPVAEVRPPGPPVTPAPEESRSGLGGQRVVALGAAGVGVAGIVVGSIFGLEAFSRHSDSQRECPGGACTPAGSNDVQSGKSAGNVATVAFSVGGIALAGAAALWLLAPGAGSTTGSVHAAPLVARDGAGLAVGGAW
jgi:hypothetical protein